MGVLVTVLVQSSSTSTSIIITMVAADLLTVEQAIPLIMGANIGTSVTSTIVALGHTAERSEFRRAFAAATVHDMFNFACVALFLPIEMATGYLYHLSSALVDASPGLQKGNKPPDILKQLTKPFTSYVIKLDKKVITKYATCEGDECDALDDKRMLKHFFGSKHLSDSEVGIIMLVSALLLLCTTLFLIVWTLKSLLKGRVAVWLHKSVNGNVPDLRLGTVTIPLGWLSGYLAMLVGVGVTICVQSSSITTSALTPLVGVGVITVDRMYPVVLGANIGTCVTGMLAALAADGSKLYLTLQVAYSHLFFNLSGIFVWYVVWPMRTIPISSAKFLGNTTAKYRWFALAYLVVCFFLIPLVLMGISFASIAGCVAVVAVAVFFALAVAAINQLQARNPSLLPPILRTWEWLPLWARSLEPFDRVVCGPVTRKLALCPSCPKSKAAKERSAQKASTTTAASKDLEAAVARL